MDSSSKFPLPFNQLSQFKNLSDHQKEIQPLKMAELFAAGSGRFSAFNIKAAGLSLDYSKNRINDKTMPLLCGLARACSLP